VVNGTSLASESYMFTIEGKNNDTLAAFRQFFMNWFLFNTDILLFLPQRNLHRERLRFCLQS
jgi:hypothetical protein